MGIPKILIVIHHEPADKIYGGERTVGQVVGVLSNLPSRYLDVVIREGEVTLRDQEGCASGWRFDMHPRGEVPFEIEIEPSTYSEPAEDSQQRPEAVEEWSVIFWHDDSVKSALVLKASDVVAAAQRVQQEFPQCRITHIEEADLSEHPMTFLDEEPIILPVGGPRVQAGGTMEQ